MILGVRHFLKAIMLNESHLSCDVIATSEQNNVVSFVQKQQGTGTDQLHHLTIQVEERRWSIHMHFLLHVCR
jgi:hypothetical protein